MQRLYTISYYTSTQCWFEYVRAFVLVQSFCAACQRKCFSLHNTNPLNGGIGQKRNPFFPPCLSPHLSLISPSSLPLFRMMLANFLGRKGRETCLKGVVVFSAGWDVFECTASLEKPLDRFLFNSYLTSCLQASVHRSARARLGLTRPLTHCWCKRLNISQA